MITLTFISADGAQEKQVRAEIGDTILTVAHANDIDIEGTCEGCMACSTCHVILDPDHFDALPEASEFEEDMLELAAGLQPTSRLGCQITLDANCDGMRLQLPATTRNLLIG